MMLTIMKVATGLVKKDRPEGCPFDFSILVQAVIVQLNENGIIVSCNGRHKEGGFGVHMDVCRSCPFFGAGKTYSI